MSVTGLCQVCEAAPARHTCPRCGRAVCEDHWRDAGEICTACAQGRQQ
ncbi:zinc finger HIT domain-containing protein [Halorubrum salsamenti]|nr:zinc finger HIT domain-containing protein [Halorubrum salsamenti]